MRLCMEMQLLPTQLSQSSTSGLGSTSVLFSSGWFAGLGVGLSVPKNVVHGPDHCKGLCWHGLEFCYRVQAVHIACQVPRRKIEDLLCFVGAYVRQVPPG